MILQLKRGLIASFFVPCIVWLKNIFLYYMKGKQLLYNTVVPTSLTIAEGEKGKRNTFIDRRHDAMACRYYYYATICRLRYDDCLLYLSNEFYLTPNVVVLNLKKRLAFINRMVATETTTAELRRRYPYFDWSTRVIAHSQQP